MHTIFLNLSWDEVIPMSCVAYNFVPNEDCKESTVFLMFGWDAFTPLVQWLDLKIRYMGNDKTFLALDTVHDKYALLNS